MRSFKLWLFVTIVAFSAVLVQHAFADDDEDDVRVGFIRKLGEEMDVRSGARILADESAVGTVILPDEAAATPTGGSSLPQIQLRRDNQQINHPGFDYVQIFTGFRPFVHATQSEVSIAAFNRNIVATYNDSTGIHVAPNPSGPGLVVDRVQLSRFSVSNDGGRTWSTGLFPGSNITDTYGDPSVGVDRHGVFYFANLAGTVSGTPAAFHGTIQVNKSTDGGKTWSAGVIVQQDDESDKEWLAVGPDPNVKSRDNVYVTWTSFQQNACELRLGRSIDEGTTWTAKTIFVPTSSPNPVNPQNCLQFSNPVVDQATGRLYVPFLRFSNADQDFLQMLVSDDAGDTFHFASFDISPWSDKTLLPVTQPGTLTACGGTNLRLTIHTATNPGPGLFGFPRYVNASRLVVQPAAAAFNGTVYVAWSNSTSNVFGDPNSNSNILLIRSTDGGATWSSPLQVNPTVADNKQHVLPSLAIGHNQHSVHVSYYTQHADGTVDLHLANSLDGADSFPADRSVRVTRTSANLPPTNIPLSNAPDFASTNYDRSIAQCYALGEYQGITTANGSVYTAWGDVRNLLTEPVNALDPISGQTHSQEDVFFQKVKAQ